MHRCPQKLDGKSFESRSARLLEDHGMRIVARRFSCRRGEIDLIAVDEHRLLFVEVRARQSRRFGGALASVDARKRGKLVRCAQQFLQTHPQWQHLPCRFDVIAWEPGNSGADKQALRARWIRAAFLV